MSGLGKLVSALAVILTLAGCESVGGWMGGDKTAGSVAPQSASGTASTKLSDLPQARPVAPQAGAMPYQAPVTSLSGGSVEVYSLDASSPASSSMTTFSTPSAMDSAAVPAVTRDYSGVTLASDPSVTVFPLDGDMSGSTGSIYGGSPVGAPMPISPVYPAEDAKGVSNPPPKTGAGVSSVYFPYGSANLDGKDRTALDTIAETAKFAPVDRVSVEGHASPETQTSDPVEARILNLRESLKRAGTVSEKLIAKGVPAEKIKTVGWGDSAPSGGGKEQQRRVDVVTGGGN